MEIEFCKSDMKACNNEIKRIKYNITVIPLLTIYKYFFWNYENIYFLILALFQLSTLWFLPTEWSPTGPFSTAIPLLMCIIMEIITDMIKWYKDYKLDWLENNQIFKCIDE